MPVTRMRFKADNNGTYYIDLAKALSLQERKLHRQKMIYTVYGGFFVDSQGQRIDINAAPLTWVTKRAVNRGFNMWRKMTSKTLKDAGATSKSKYRDFKLRLNSAMTTSPLLPLDAAGNNLYSTAPEWDYATLASEDPDGPGGTGPDEFDLHIVGPHAGSDPNWTRIGLIQSWINSRPALQTSEPLNVPDTGDPLMNLFDDGDAMDDRLDLINSENDARPYDEQFTFGNVSASSGEHNLQRMSVAKPTGSTLPVAPIHGFDAICGLIQLVVGADSAANQWELVLDVESKGVKF